MIRKIINVIQFDDICLFKHAKCIWNRKMRLNPDSEKQENYCEGQCSISIRKKSGVKL